MNKKFSLGIVISLVAISCAITYVITITVSTNLFNQRLNGVVEREEIYSKIQEIDSYVRSASYYDIDDQTLMSSIVNGYTSGLNDSEAQYLSAEEAYRIQQIESGTIISTGIIAEKEESGYIIVKSVYADSPAESSGVMAGDIITDVDGANVLEIGAQSAISALEGDENTNVKITVQRGGETMNFTLTRRSFTIQSVSCSMAASCGYIRINAFNALTAAKFSEAIQTLQSQGATGFVIDLRDCGGTFDGLQQMLSVFISQNLLANAQYKDGTMAKFLETTGEATVSSPVVIVVNESTESAAELFAVSMRDFASAKLVGKQTAGKMTVVGRKTLSDGTVISVTSAMIIPEASDVSGGIKPDFVIEQTGEQIFNPTETASSDPQLNKAFEVLESFKSS